LAAGANEAGILAAIKAFEPLPHRLQEIEVSGTRLVDDSIATTPAATEAALNAYPIGRVALIAGGHDRGQDYESLAAQIARSNVGLVATLPVTGKRLAEALRAGGAATEIIEAPNLESAMRQLADRRGRFDIVLLSPGAPSFGQFRDFEERGEKFIEFARHHFR
jgi:UDP-N-acetylmuramoylalanine--D-glutamate ligase